jgi:hypothetical protein
MALNQGQQGVDHRVVVARGAALASFHQESVCFVQEEDCIGRACLFENASEVLLRLSHPLRDDGRDGNNLEGLVHFAGDGFCTQRFAGPGRAVKERRDALSVGQVSTDSPPFQHGAAVERCGNQLVDLCPQLLGKNDISQPDPGHHQG